MKYVILSMMLLTTLTTPAMANPPLPPIPEGGIKVVMQGPCNDKESGEEGSCRLYRDVSGTFYIMFVQNGDIKFIRKILPGGGYEEIWIADKFNTF